MVSIEPWSPWSKCEYSRTFYSNLVPVYDINDSFSRKRATSLCALLKKEEIFVILCDLVTISIDQKQQIIDVALGTLCCK